MIRPDLPPLALAPDTAQRAAELALARTGGPRTGLGSAVLDHVTRFAQEQPERTAVVDADRALDYAGLLARAAEIGGALRAAGCTTGSVVAVVGDRSADSIAVFLALEGLGAVYLPVDPDWPAVRVADVLGTSAALLLLDCAGGRGGTAATAATAAGVTVIDVPEGATATAEPFTPAYDRSLEPRYCIFTSGTTGRPKGALVEHRGMMNHLWAKVEDLALTGDDRLAFTAPLVFDISIWQMLAPLLVGGTVVVVPRQALDFPRRLLRLLTSTGVTVVELVPTVLGWLVDEAARHPGGILPALRWLISTGEELPPALAARALAALPTARLLNAYGPTECSDDVTHHEVTASDTGRQRLPVGGPVTGARLYLLVAQGSGWRAAEPGEVGELFVGGVVTGLGYLNDPERTAAAFFTDPLDPASPTGRLYATGDLARFQDGVAHYLGRVDRQVKVAGVRMELDEIEAVLRRHPAVGQCAVTVAEPAGRQELTAHYTALTPVTTDELRGHLAATLPTALVPRHLVELDELPLTPNGKTDHRTLQQLAQTARTPSSAKV
ncbi:amino acid adenylation domain-containing protein (plasmid) [Streptomyces sp. HUAS TT11]|uniref:amino acid adenylation domain-containing protein n=1 Tax=Streptomyces sp. HUAS TT11 TaxID=3447508 RepID=UPI003F65DE42